MADVGDEVKMRFSKLGVSQEDLTAMQAQYVKLQGMSGQAYKLQTMDMRQLREQSTAYAENLVKMSAITGKSAEEQQRREEIMRSQYEERSQIINEENQKRTGAKKKPMHCELAQKFGKGQVMYFLKLQVLKPLL